jgi:sulfatase modifying factor 1
MSDVRRKGRRQPPVRRASTMRHGVILAVFVVTAGLGWTLYAAQRPAPASMPASSSFLPTQPNRTTPPGFAPVGMVWIPGGEFSMGAADPVGKDMNDVGMNATRDSRPTHRVYVDGFWMDKTDVTNEQFAQFVKATGYVTVADREIPCVKLRSDRNCGAPECQEDRREVI